MRQLLGRLAPLITLVLLTPLAIVAAILVSQQGGALGEVLSAALLVYFAGSILLAGPAMFAGIFLDAHDNLFVAELSGARIQVFDSAGDPLAMWGEEGSGPGQFGNLHGIIVSEDGTVYVADTANHRIQAFRKTSAPRPRLPACW